jgi:CIC family chloride channel protein
MPGGRFFANRGHVTPTGKNNRESLSIQDPIMNWLLPLERTPRLILLSLFLGIVGALGAQVFLWLLNFGEIILLQPITGYAYIHVEAAHAMGEPPAIRHWYWLIPVATTLGGLISGFLVYTWASEAEGHGTDAAVKAFHRKEGNIRARVPLIKTVASAITIGSGGAAGREGPTAQIAAGIGSIVGSLLRLSTNERRYLVLIGMAAGLSAIFKSPLGTAIFSVEILYAGMAFEAEVLIFSLIAAAVAYAITGMIDGFAPLFILPTHVGIDSATELTWYALIGVIAGVVGAVLPSVFYYLRDAFHALKIPNQFKPAIGGFILGLIGIFVPELLGGGYGYMQFALQGAAGMGIGMLLLLSLGKIVAMSLTISSGGSGGVFAPSLFVGTLLGAAIAAILHDLGVPANESALAVVGMAALFAGAARVPIASLIMVVEMTGGYHMVAPTMLAVAISFVVQYALTRRLKYPTLYEAQVLTLAESPAHRDTYYQVVADLLRQRQIQLDRDILSSEIAHTLASGAGVPISHSETRLYSLDEMHVLIVGIIRGEHEIIPHGSTVLQVGDSLLVTTTRESIQGFEAMIAVPAHKGEKRDVQDVPDQVAS